MLASVAGAAFLGLAASGLVRANLSEIMSALVEIPFQASLAESLSPSADPAPAEVEAGPENPPPEGQPSPSLVARTKRTTRGRSARSAPVRVANPDTFALALAKGIRKVGERRYEIQRPTLELALDNLPALASWVRVAPAVRAGQSLGFRLFAIPEEGPFAKLGLRNDDVLIAVNGLTVASLDQALEVYRKLRTARHLVLGLVRGGHELTQEYTIR